ncbi:hypothetical protein [Acaryochloris sp. IP29b_bin.137]|uniref:hypothetical protein n=1 Tax=Acaryochloris sp. IP29b_bin.137 TaxID=2969217 RepID=UPI00260CC6AF|nr:hypothetical protein [Acaryochloris sp. IP29b_bin.137]
MKLSIQEISITIAAKGLSPSILNPDFLKYSDIVPSDWQYEKEPVFASNGAHIAYTNGIRITAQPNRVSFAQAFATKEHSKFQINTIAANFLEKLPGADYQAVGINPRGIVPFLENEHEAYEFLFQKLFSVGSWQKFGQAPVQAAVQLGYVLDQGNLNLAINEAKLNAKDQASGSAVVFSGNFNYPVLGDAKVKRLQSIKERIELWQTSVTTFQQLINEHFLGVPNESSLDNSIPVAPPALDREMVL